MKGRIIFNRFVVVLVVFFFGGYTANAQEPNLQQTTKTIMWSKVEDGYTVQLINENGHEYILRTPLSNVNEAAVKMPFNPTLSAKNVALGVARSVRNKRYTVSALPEIQSDELIKSRLHYMQSSVPLTYNSEVRHQINRLLRYRANLEMNLGRSQYYMGMIDSVVAVKGMPRELKYLPLVESEYKIGGYSRRGARGIWQFMSPTARMYGLKVSSVSDQRLHPEKSTAAAFEYLSDLYEMFDDWELALAAYNAGPGRVRRAMRNSGKTNPTFWDIRYLLAKETRDYVPKFVAAVYVMEHYDQIGLWPDYNGTTKAAEQTAALRKIGFRTNWNPRMDAASIPANSTVMNYTVKSGDNLGFIAEWYDVKASQLRAWNGIRGNLIKSGQELAIYVPSSKKNVYSGINKLSFNQKQGGGSDKKKGEKEKMAALRQTTANFVVYTIKTGDTLWDISRKNNVSVETIKQLNNISNTRNLKPGMVLKIREK